MLLFTHLQFQLSFRPEVVGVCFLGACICAVFDIKLICNNQPFACLYTVVVCFLRNVQLRKYIFYLVHDSKRPFQMLKVVCRWAINDIVTKHLATLHPRILQREYTKGRSDQVVICFPCCMCCSDVELLKFDQGGGQKQEIHLDSCQTNPESIGLINF